MNARLLVAAAAAAIVAFAPLRLHAQSGLVPVRTLGLVPRPRSVVAYASTCLLPARMTIAARSPDARGVARFARRFLAQRQIAATVTAAGSAAAAMRLEERPNDTELGPEGYRLHVGSDGVRIVAAGGAGLYYGLQTFEELFDPSDPADRSIHRVDIVDWPRYRWRGIHLDVSRHFFSVPVVERYIDVAAHYKLNVFHWHLTDDQGWRIQIRRYPRLTSVGSCRAGTEIGHDASHLDHTRYCGFYTQAQIRQVVAYAQRRYVTIVPEIEMPGHAAAALAAYPKLGCRPGPFHVLERWGGTPDVVCPSRYAFRFFENVLSEVVKLFPGRYVHVGGDEVETREWRSSPVVHALMKREHLSGYAAVQGYWERRIEAYLRAKGRRMVGWDEILAGGVSKAATVMSWRGETGGIAAAKRGNDVVMAPDGPLYFDAYQGSPADEPEAIGGLTTLQMVYAYDPTPAALTPRQAAHVLGVEGCVWTEWIATPSHLFYMLLPRELALAEIAWTPEREKNYASFLTRTGAQYAWLQARGYTFRIPNPQFSLDAPVRFENVSPSVRTIHLATAARTLEVALSQPVPGAVIRYTTDGSSPTARSRVYRGALSLAVPAPARALVLKAVTVLSNGRTSTPSELEVYSAQ